MQKIINKCIYLMFIEKEIERRISSYEPLKKWLYCMFEIMVEFNKITLNQRDLNKPTHQTDTL